MPLKMSLQKFKGTLFSATYNAHGPRASAQEGLQEPAVAMARSTRALDVSAPVRAAPLAWARPSAALGTSRFLTALEMILRRVDFSR